MSFKLKCPVCSTILEQTWAQVQYKGNIYGETVFYWPCLTGHGFFLQDRELVWLERDPEISLKQLWLSLDFLNKTPIV